MQGWFADFRVWPGPNDHSHAQQTCRHSGQSKVGKYTVFRLCIPADSSNSKSKEARAVNVMHHIAVVDSDKDSARSNDNANSKHGDCKSCTLVSSFVSYVITDIQKTFNVLQAALIANHRVFCCQMWMTKIQV
jgi:hypothetical protein